MPLHRIMTSGVCTMSVFPDNVKFCAIVDFENSKQDLNFQGMFNYAELQNQNTYGKFTNNY